MSITVVDSIMGSGKSTWARNYMNSHPERRWWYLAIRLKEAGVSVEGCPNIEFYEPSDENKKKSDDLISLIKKGVNISSTHQLFEKIKQTPELLALIESQGYTLVIDEVLDNLVEDMNKFNDDIVEKLESKTFSVDDDTGKLTWLKDNYKGDFQDVKQKSQAGEVYYNGETLIALYNPAIFSAFQEVYVLTYIFNGSRMRMYFDFYGLEYRTKYIFNGELSPEKPNNLAEKQRISDLITQYPSDGPLYDIGIRRYETYTLSQNWYTKRQYYTAQESLFKNTYNYLHNQVKARSKDTMFTIFKNVYNKNPYLLPSYKKSFVECSAKATNDYRDRVHLAYLVNMFQDPEIEKFFSPHGVVQDEDAFARSSMVQWIWRSAIRDSKPITLFIPSPRMRSILDKWLKESD